MLDALAAVAIFASLHSADPGATGTNEIAGGTPAYARKSITWNSASAGALDSSNQPVFDVEGGDTVAFVGLWSASTAGTFYGSADVTDETFGGQGTYTLTDFDITLT
jgi:hypothetical protein